MKRTTQFDILFCFLCAYEWVYDLTLFASLRMLSTRHMAVRHKCRVTDNAETSTTKWRSGVHWPIGQRLMNFILFYFSNVSHVSLKSDALTLRMDTFLYLIMHGPINLTGSESFETIHFPKEWANFSLLWFISDCGYDA